MDAAAQFVTAKATSAALGALGANVSAADFLQDKQVKYLIQIWNYYLNGFHVKKF